VEAFVKKDGGQIVEGEGRPDYILPDDQRLLTRYELIELIMPYMPEVKIELTPFNDSNDPMVLGARALQIVSGYNNYFRPKDEVSAAEVYVVLQKAFFPYKQLPNHISLNYDVKWAEKSVRILFDNQVLDYGTIRMGKMTVGDFKDYLYKVAGGMHD
jgi:hypothetical protein